ncbi:MAG: HPr family phosphocarrier protein [Limisphaerales bacterium]
MKRAAIKVPWKAGLHMRQAGLLVRVACKFASTIQLEYNGHVANARSILGIILLCATMGSTIEIEASGEDEEKAIHAIQELFTDEK